MMHHEWYFIIIFEFFFHLIKLLNGKVDILLLVYPPRVWKFSYRAFKIHNVNNKNKFGTLKRQREKKRKKRDKESLKFILLNIMNSSIINKFIRLEYAFILNFYYSVSY